MSAFRLFDVFWFYCVAVATGVLNVGSRTDNRDTFFCLAKRKYPKKMPPGFRHIPALLAFGEGFRKGLPAPPKTSGIPAAPLTGYSCQKLRCSGRNNGTKTQSQPQIQNLRYVLRMETIIQQLFLYIEFCRLG